MKEITLTPAMSRVLSGIYDAIEREYDQVATSIALTCTGCPDNCCDSYFLHYTYSEWAFLWEGLRQLKTNDLERIIESARDYVRQSREVLGRDERPKLMCPLNDGGRCALYHHRLMICRLHGVPASMTRPDGRTLSFPGCFRCQEIVPEASNNPAMDRTTLLTRVASLESELLGGKRHLFPKVRLTIAEMIAGGPPMIDKPLCEK